MELTLMLILLIINFLLYGMCCFIIMRRKNFTCISIRSPRLLILNILGNFFMSVIIIVTEYLENDGKKICSYFYYVTHFLIIIPFCLRFRRIIKCCEININERLELQELYNNKYKFEENYNIKIMLIIFAILTGIMLLVNVLATKKEAITAIFLYMPPDENPLLAEVNSYFWLAFNFIEHIIFLSFAYHICVNQLKQKLRFEIISCFVIWFIYSNLMSIFEMASSNINNNVYIFISIAVCYLFLIINAILPIAISYLFDILFFYS